MCDVSTFSGCVSLVKPFTFRFSNSSRCKNSICLRLLSFSYCSFFQSSPLGSFNQNIFDTFRTFRNFFINISSDINECQTNPCGENAVCKDTIGSYVCVCKEDYTGDPFRGCVDINECEALEKPCGTHAICENAVPGYNCLCPQGYQASPSPQIACEQVSCHV